MPTKKRSAFRRFMKSVDQTPSPYEIIVWAFLLFTYFAWAALSPVLPNSKGAETAAPMIALAILLVLYMVKLPHSLDFLVLFSAITMAAAPAILILNGYRILFGLFPASWSRAGFWQGPVVFVGIQVVVTALFVGNFLHTLKRWKAGDPSEKRSLLKQIMFLLVLAIVLLIPVLYFVFAGRWRMPGG